MQHRTLTVRPGQVIGLRNARRHERPGLYPIFAIGGASPEGDDDAAKAAADKAAADAAAADAAAKTAADAAAADAAAKAAAAVEKVEDLPAWAQKIISDTRKEAGDNRAAKTAAEQAQQETLDKIAKALGLKDDEKPDAGKLAEQLTATQAEARTLKVERALDKAARKHGADEDLLVAVLAHNGKLAKLDPTADDFATELDALVKATVAANPKLKATLAAAASGVDGEGGSGEKPPADLQSVDEMRKLLKPKS